MQITLKCEKCCDKTQHSLKHNKKGIIILYCSGCQMSTEVSQQFYIQALIAEENIPQKQLKELAFELLSMDKQITDLTDVDITVVKMIYPAEVENTEHLKGKFLSYLWDKAWMNLMDDITKNWTKCWKSHSDLGLVRNKK